MGQTPLVRLNRLIDAGKATVVVCLLPDTGERYLSTPLFAFSENA